MPRGSRNLIKVGKAMATVHVVNKSCALCVCCDFKVSINLVLHVDKYPLAHIEDIFASLAGGQAFSKIELL